MPATRGRGRPPKRSSGPAEMEPSPEPAPPSEPSKRSSRRSHAMSSSPAKADAPPEPVVARRGTRGRPSMEPAPSEPSPKRSRKQKEPDVEPVPERNRKQKIVVPETESKLVSERSRKQKVVEPEVKQKSPELTRKQKVVEPEVEEESEPVPEPEVLEPIKMYAQVLEEEEVDPGPEVEEPEPDVMEETGPQVEQTEDTAPMLDEVIGDEEPVRIAAVVEAVEDQYDMDRPPQLEPEPQQHEEELMMTGDISEDHSTLVHRPQMTQRMYMSQSIQPVISEAFHNEDGVIVAEDDYDEGVLMPDLRTVEFNFLDNKNICCGLCGEIVPYDSLMNDHLPNQHPEVLGEGDMTMEEIPYEEWLREKLRAEKRAIESGFKVSAYEAPARVHRTANRVQRRVSQIRVNPTEMSVAQLDSALKKKMVEKMGRKVPVTLVDKQHARCGLCNAVVSLNKKFEVVHLVRHFNAWHPSAHRCSGSWIGRVPTRPNVKPLSQHDFAVIDSSSTTPDNLQCIWCGMFMDADSLAMHFDEVHPDDIEVPKCNLCLQELVINARMQEKFGEDFEISLPDEHHIRVARWNTTIGSEGALEKLIEKKMARRQERISMGLSAEDVEDEDDVDGDDDLEDVGPEAFLNSRMSLGRRKKPKRQFIMPALRQAAPLDSEYVEPVTECQWKCKLCNGDILAAVISAGAIKHYRSMHPDHLDAMQYELCKARLERVSDGCMEFVHPQLIECLLCNMTYNLHKPFNMCRAVRHLKSKHPNLMPEYAGVSAAQPASSPQVGQGTSQQDGVELRTVESLEQLKELYGIDISKMQQMTNADGEQVFVLVPDGGELDSATAEQLARALGGATTTSVAESSQSAESTRVLTLQVGKEGALEPEESEQNDVQDTIDEQGIAQGEMDEDILARSLNDDQQDISQDRIGDQDMSQDRIDDQDMSQDRIDDQDMSQGQDRIDDQVMSQEANETQVVVQQKHDELMPEPLTNE